jgi:hypothetical protein
MRVKALFFALLVAIFALPVPASQLLNGALSAHAPATIVPGNQHLSLLLQDPFLIDQMSFERPASFLDLGENAF